MAFEVEVKYRLDRPDEFKQSLVAHGATHVRSAIQEDHYFDHPSRSFAASDEAFRIRRDDDALFLTYKGPKLDAKTKTRREIEVPVGESAADLPRLQEMISALGFRPVAVVRKQRDYWIVPWDAGRVEVVVDRVRDVGSFAELEMSAEAETLDATKKSVLTLASRLGLTGSVRESYLELLLRRPQ